MIRLLNELKTLRKAKKTIRNYLKLKKHRGAFKQYQKYWFKLDEYGRKSLEKFYNDIRRLKY